jgi:hypothetical protein
MLIDIHLGHNAEYTLTYELVDNTVSRYIWDCYKNNDYEFVSRTQFYNFGESQEEIQAKLDECIVNIRRLQPELIIEDTDLNRLHENFPDNVHDTQGELRHWLSMFNYHIHHLEFLETAANRRFLLSVATGSPAPRDLTDDEYDLFNPSRIKNNLYMNYPHVGKHLMEIVRDQDIEIPESHIIPTSLAKADLLCWFDEDQFVGQEAEVVDAVKDFCKQIEHKLPYALDDKRLAIGHIHLGKLTHEPDLKQIGQNKYVHSIESR